MSAGVDRTIAYGTTIRLNGEFTNSADATVVIGWGLSDSTATTAAFVTAGLTMAEAQMEVTRLTTALAGLTADRTFPAPAADLGLTSAVALAFTITVTDSTAPAGQPTSATSAMDEVVFMVVDPAVAPVFTNPMLAAFEPGDARIEYEVAEDTLAVNVAGLFAATMGEGGEPAMVSLSGPDAGFFEIDGGTLSFIDPPDRAMPRGQPLTDMNTNDYYLTLTANPQVDIIVRVVENTTPTFAAPIAPQIYALNTAVTLTLPLATGGNGTITHILTGPNGMNFSELPAGLTFDPATRTITGTPTTVTPARIFTWTATDANGDTAPLTFPITVNEQELTPVIEQWLARFGRSVATQAVETIGDRMTGMSSPGSQLTLGGRQLSLNDLARGYASPGAGWAGSHQPIKSHQPVGSHQPISRH